MDKIQIQVRYTVDTEKGKFSDALYYTLDEWPNVTEEQMETEKQKRVAAWIYAINNPPPPEDPPEDIPLEE